jgi:hypothetical protein
VKQGNIINNNHAIAQWLKEHPGKPLSEPQTEEIIRAREIAEVREIANLKQEIASWHGDHSQEAMTIFHKLENVDQFSNIERGTLLSALAEKVGDHHGLINMGNPAEVSARIKDYLVGYPEAKQFGFENYDAYAGVRDVSLRHLVEQIPPNGKLADALHHTTFHPGGYFEELRGGKIVRVPLTREHVQLGHALERITGRSEAGKTVGQVLAERAGFLDQRVAAVKGNLTRILNRAA